MLKKPTITLRHIRHCLVYWLLILTRFDWPNKSKCNFSSFVTGFEIICCRTKVLRPALMQVYQDTCIFFEQNLTKNWRPPRLRTFGNGARKRGTCKHVYFLTRPHCLRNLLQSFKIFLKWNHPDFLAATFCLMSNVYEYAIFTCECVHPIWFTNLNLCWNLLQLSGCTKNGLNGFLSLLYPHFFQMAISHSLNFIK